MILKYGKYIVINWKKIVFFVIEKVKVFYYLNLVQILLNKTRALT